VCGCVVTAAGGDNYSEVAEVTLSSSTSAVVPVPNPSALYTVVSRNRTAPSQTNAVRVTSSISGSGSTAGSGAVTDDARRDLYTRVVRRPDGVRHSSPPVSWTTVQPGGGGSTSISLSADGYASIDDPPQTRQQQNYANNGVDFYDVIHDNLPATAPSDIDPIPPPTVTTASSLACSSADSATGFSSTVGRQQQHDPALTASSVTDASSGQQNDRTARHRRLPIREHIYDEVSSPPGRSTSTVTHSDV